MIKLSENSIAQTAHFFIGTTLVLIPVAMKWPDPRLIGSLGSLVFAAIKEFYFDIKYEDPATCGGWEGSLEDFSWYCAGIIAVNLLLCL